MDEENDSGNIFKAIRYYCVGLVEKEIKDILNKGKAKAESYLSALVTHVIVADPTHYEAEAAKDVWYIPTVTPTWVTSSLMCKTLLPTAAFSSASGQIFSGIVASFSRLAKKDKAILWALITFHGGYCQAKLNKLCTHLITLSPTGDKYNEALKHDGITIVTPDWVMDSVKLIQIQSTESYHPQLNIVSEKKGSTGRSEQPLPDVTKVTIHDSSSEANVKKTIVTASNQVNITELQPDIRHSTTLPSHATILSSNASATVSSQSQTQLAQVPTSGKMSQLPFMSAPPTCISTQNPIQMMKYSNSTAFNRPASLQPGNSTARFSLPSVPSMRSPMQTPTQPAPSSGQFTFSSTGQQFSLISSNNHQSIINVASSGQPQRPMMSPTSPYVVMSPPPRPVGSPRRSSNQQSGGGKKKKSGGGSHSTRPSLPSHSTVRQVHPINTQYQPTSQAMFSPQQQQMILKPRIPNSPDQIGLMPGGGVTENSLKGSSDVRFMQGRFPNSNMLTQQPDNYQHMQQQQLLQMQQQQQIHRMAMMRQTPPGIQAHHVSMDSTQQKWPRQALEMNNFPVDHQGQPLYSQHAQPSNNANQQSMVRQTSMPQQSVNGQPMAMSGTQNNQASHQHYNPMIMNRFPTQMNPHQQMVFQQMQQQQQQRPPGNSRFPTSTSLEAAGMTGISPVALQQGLLNSAHLHADHTTLVHPSLQGAMFSKAPTSTQNTGSSSQKRRTKSRKKSEMGDEEAKAKPRPRSKSKKSPSASTAITTVIDSSISPMQTSTIVHSQFLSQGISGMSMSSNASMMSTFASSNLHPTQTSLVVPHGNVSQPQPTSLPQHITSTSPMTQHLSQPNIKLNSAASAAPVSVANNKLSAGNYEEKINKESEVTREFIDPLKYSIKELDVHYVTRDSSDSVPCDLFLLGCVFHICEYDEVLNDSSTIDLWKKTIGKYGGIVEDTYTTLCTHLMCVSLTTPLCRQALSEGRRCVTVYWLNDVLQLRTLRVPWLVLHLPTFFAPNNKPLANHIMSYTGFHAKERERLNMMGFVAGVKFTGFLSRSHSGLVCKSNVNSLKFNKANSWMVPCVNLLWLRDSVHTDNGGKIEMKQPKYQVFGNEANAITGFLLDISKCRHLLESWKVPVRISRECLDRAKVKRKFDTITSAPSLPKRVKPNECYQAIPRVCFTGIMPARSQDLQQKLLSLKGLYENRFALCTHLVAGNVSRTVKFLSCISSCSYVLTPEWIEESVKAGRLLEEDKFLLVDKTTEKKFNFSLQESIRRARSSPLFKDCLFCVTDNVVPEKKTLKQIIECAGGRMLNKMPTLSVLKHMKTKTAPSTRILIISCPDDESLYKPLKKEGLIVHNAEIVLTGVLKQEVNLIAHRL